MNIIPRHVNVALCQELKFYHADSHAVFLELARKYPAEKKQYLIKAAVCRKMYRDVWVLLKLAQPKTIH